MTSYVRKNALDQALDIAGSLNQESGRTLSDENAGFGKLVQSGTNNLTFAAPGVGGVQNVTGMAGMTAGSPGNYFSVDNTTLNDGVYLIVAFNAANDIDIVNAGGAVEGPVSTDWIERSPYVLEDDLNFVRTDRKAIKGTTNYYDAIPTYVRPTATGTPVPADLTNIASKTTDAKALCINRRFPAAAVVAATSHKTLVDVAGALQHATAGNRTGVPINDGADAGADEAVYVEIINPATEAALEVLGGGDIGKRIFGRTRAGAGGVAATGSITTDLQNQFTDGDYFTMHDGTSLGLVTYYFDVTGGYLPPGGVWTATKVHVNISTDVTANDVRDRIILAINGATQVITASSGGAGLVSLVNDNIGAQGVQAMTKLSGSAVFAVAGMTGGTMGFAPYSVDVEFRAVAKGAALSTSVAYTWEAGQPTTVDMFYAYRERLDNLTDTALRTTLTNGIVGDADMSQDIADIRSTIGINDGDTSLAGKLTPATNFYLWSDLPDGTPSVVEALNTINDQVGARTWTGGILTPGDNLTDALQDLADAIGATSIIRTIERRATAIPAGTYHLLPGGITYTPDAAVPTNGKNMFVFWRGVLRDPGTVVDGDDYEETDSTHITVYSRINANEHLNYLVLA